MQVLLTTLNAKYIHLNLAIRLLYDMNKDREGLSWKEFTIKEAPEKIAAYCQNFELVAFSCYIWNLSQTLEVCHQIKALNPNVKIMLGGPEVSYEWEDLIALDAVDFIITGEGEIPFQRFLMDYPKLDAVPSLVRKEDGHVHYNPEIQGFDLKDYAQLQPYQHDKPGSLKNKVLYIETSRGCPYKCEFCLASLDNKVRYLPMESIQEMLLYLMQNGKVIKFLDRTFNVKKAFTLEVFQFILDHYQEGNVFQFEITADIIRPEIIDFIHEKVPKGLFRFEIGIQTVNQVANRAMQRKQDFEKTKKMIKALQDKVEMHLDLIVGLPFDYWADIKHSFEAVFELFAPELQLGFLKFLKGTPLRDKDPSHGFVFDPAPPYQLIESVYLSKEELAKIEQLEQALEIYWNKPRAIELLKYVALHYSSFDFLMQLGVFFGERQAYIGYGLQDIYTTLFDFIETQYPDDPILRQLAAYDYYSYSKLRPKPIEGAEIAHADLHHIIESKGMDKHAYRYIGLHFDFDFNTWQKELCVKKSATNLILGYNGKIKAQQLMQVSP